MPMLCAALTGTEKRARGKATLPRTRSVYSLYSQYMRRADRDRGTGLILASDRRSLRRSSSAFRMSIGARCRQGCAGLLDCRGGQDEGWGPCARPLSLIMVGSWACIGLNCACAPRGGHFARRAEAPAGRGGAALVSCTSRASGPTMLRSLSTPSRCLRASCSGSGGEVRDFLSWVGASFHCRAPCGAARGRVVVTSWRCDVFL